MNILDAIRTGKKITSPSLIKHYGKSAFIVHRDGLFYDETGEVVQLYSDTLEDLMDWMTEDWRFFEVEFQSLSIGDRFCLYLFGNYISYIKVDEKLAVMYDNGIAIRNFAEFEPSHLVVKE